MTNAGRMATRATLSNAWRVAATVVFAAVLAGCGGGSDEPAPPAGDPASQGAATGTAPVAKPTPHEAPTVKGAPEGTRLTKAVPDSKTTAPLDLEFDIPVRPDVGQPFTVVLAASSRLPVDKLDVEVSDSPGVVIEGERMGRFLNVEGGQAHAIEVRARGDAPGMFYLGVIVKSETKVQTESRAFAVPVVIGSPPPAEKAAPTVDAAGQPVQPMPATESTQ